jgi:enamidase
MRGVLRAPARRPGRVTMAATRAPIRNIGRIATGDIARPLADGDSIAIAAGRIAAVGRGLDGGADTGTDARGFAAIPGLIDSRCLPVFGDFTPRQRTIDFLPFVARP